MNTTSILRSKGQLTIPAGLREELGINENDVLTILPLNKHGFLVIPKNLETVNLFKETEAIAKSKGITLEEMLLDLEEIRKKA